MHVGIILRIQFKVWLERNRNSPSFKDRQTYSYFIHDVYIAQCQHQNEAYRSEDQGKYLVTMMTNDLKHGLRLKTQWALMVITKKF